MTMKQWFRQSAWIYPDVDKEFLAELLEAYRGMSGWEHTEIQQTKFPEGKYPQYLPTLDPRGIGGDRCHLWRDGQTWWAMTGDFSQQEEDQCELTLRQTIRKFLVRRATGNI